MPIISALFAIFCFFFLFYVYMQFRQLAATTIFSFILLLGLVAIHVKQQDDLICGLTIRLLIIATKIDLLFANSGQIKEDPDYDKFTLYRISANNKFLSFLLILY